MLRWEPDTNSLCKNTSEVDPNPIIRQEYDGYWPIDGDDGKHYPWEYVDGIFLEVYERDLTKILACQHWSIGGMALSRIGIVACGSAGYICFMEIWVSLRWKSEIFSASPE